VKTNKQTDKRKIYKIKNKIKQQNKTVAAALLVLEIYKNVFVLFFITFLYREQSKVKFGCTASQ